MLKLRILIRQDKLYKLYMLGQVYLMLCLSSSISFLPQSFFFFFSPCKQNRAWSLSINALCAETITHLVVYPSRHSELITI